VANTLLQTIQQAASEMGLDAPTSVISNTNNLVVQWYALVNALGNEIRRQYEWQRLTKEYRFTTVYYEYTGTTTADSVSVTGMSSIVGLDSTFMVIGTGINQDTYVSSAVGTTVTLSQAASASGTVTLTFAQTKYSFPNDYDRLVDRTEWDKSRHWENLGPETGQQWQWLKSGFIATGPRVRFRPLGGYFQIWPPLSSNDYMGFEYVSNQWVLAAADTITPSKSSFTVDTDTCVFPDRLMVTGLKLKFLNAKNMEVGSIKQPGTPMYDFTMEMNLAKSYDAGSKTLSMAPQISGELITAATVPDSGYGA
jgi:hypothetical protein